MSESEVYTSSDSDIQNFLIQRWKPQLKDEFPVTANVAVGHSDVKDETTLKLYVTRMNLLFDLCDSDYVDSDSDTFVPESSDSGTLDAFDGATIEDEDEDASLGEIASDTPTQASACLQDPAMERTCMHGLRRPIRRILAPLRRTPEPRTKKRGNVAQPVCEFGSNFQSYTTRSVFVTILNLKRVLKNVAT